MAKTSLIINSTDTSGNAIQKTVTDVNPMAGSEVLCNFAKKLNALTTNTYNSTMRIDKSNVDTELDAGVTKATINFKIGDEVLGETISLNDFRSKLGAASGYLTVQTNSDGQLLSWVNGNENGYVSYYPRGHQMQMTVQNNATAFSVIAYVQATDNYTAAEVTMTVE